MGESIPADMKAADVRVAAMRAVLQVPDKKCAEFLEQAVCIMEQNLEHEDILSSEEYAGCLSAADQEELDKHVSKQKKVSEEVNALHQQIRQLSGSAAATAATGKRKPLNFPLRETWTAGEVGTYGPPKSRWYRDTFNCRWIVFIGRWSKSRSWGAAGLNDGACLQFLLGKAWERHTRLTGEPCHINFSQVR